MTRVLIRKGRDSKDAFVHREGSVMARGKEAATYQLKKEGSEETNPAGSWTLDFQLPKVWETNSCHLSHLVFCYGSLSELIQPQTAFSPGKTWRKPSFTVVMWNTLLWQKGTGITQRQRESTVTNTQGWEVIAEVFLLEDDASAESRRISRVHLGRGQGWAFPREEPTPAKERRTWHVLG